MGDPLGGIVVHDPTGIGDTHRRDRQGGTMSMQPGEPAGTQVTESGLRVSAGAIASGTGVAALLTFMLQNTDDVKVHFLVWDFTVSVWLLTLASALVGAIVWFGLGVLRRHRRRKERRQARRD